MFCAFDSLAEKQNYRVQRFILSLDLAPTMFVRNIVGVFSETYFFETAISKKIQPAMSDEPPIGATAPHIVTPVAQIK